MQILGCGRQLGCGEGVRLIARDSHGTKNDGEVLYTKKTRRKRSAAAAAKL